MRLPLFRPHSRYLEMADAFADGELSDRERSRFESHLATCDACAATVEAARETKRLLRALPEYDAPRSFRLTPAMARQTRPGRAEARPSWAPTLVLRASQATAGLAAAALAVVLIGNLGLPSSGDDDDSGAFEAASQADDKTGGASFSAATAAATSAAADPESSQLGAATPAFTGTVPPAPSAGGDGQAAPSADDTLASGSDNPNGELRDTAAPPGASAYSSSPARDDLFTQSDSSPEAQLVLNDRLSEDGADGDTFPTIEIGLAGILLAAIAAAVAASRQRKGTS